MKNSLSHALLDPNQHSTTLDLFSKHAEDERSLITFCLARLVELHKEGTDREATAKQITSEVKEVGFLETVPRQGHGPSGLALPRNSITIDEVLDAAGRFVSAKALSLGVLFNSISATACWSRGLFNSHRWLRMLRNAAIGGIVVMLVVGLLAVVGKLSLGFMKRKVFEFAQDLPVISQILSMIQIVLS